MHRRSLLKAAAQALAAPAMINLGRFSLFGQSSSKYSTRAIDLVRRATVIDMLNPFSLAATLTGPEANEATTG